MKRIIKKVCRKRFKYFRLNNDGAALISVMAVAIFLSVIATTIVYISGKNFQIKANDYQNKNTFYQAEMALDEFKGALASDVSEAFNFAYGDIMPNYVDKGSGDARNEEYKKKFFDYLYYKWTGATKYGTDIPTKDDAGNNVTHVTVAGESIYKTAENYAEKAGLENFKKYFIPEDKIDASGDEKMCVAYDDKRPGRFILKNIRVSCTKNGYSSYICTDIAMEAPSYYMGITAPPAGGGTPPATPPADEETPSAIPKDTVEKLYMGDYILYMNWHKY